jgi:hypothetical protein
MAIIRNLSVRVPWHDRAWDGHVSDELNKRLEAMMREERRRLMREARSSQS